MLLVHAQTLASELVELDGIQYPKAGPFPRGTEKREEWEPVRKPWVPPTPPEDCQCGESPPDEQI